MEKVRGFWLGRCLGIGGRYRGCFGGRKKGMGYCLFWGLWMSRRGWGLGNGWGGCCRDRGGCV